MFNALHLVSALLEADPDDVDPRAYLRALPARQAVNLTDAIWQNDRLLRNAFSWLTRVGVAPKFGTLPIAYYQEDQIKAIDKLTELANKKNLSLRWVRNKNGFFEAYDGKNGWVRFAQRWLNRIEPA